MTVNIDKFWALATLRAQLAKGGARHDAALFQWLTWDETELTGSVLYAGKLTYNLTKTDDGARHWACVDKRANTP